MIDHVSLEVSDLERSARFYDALFFALGVRRMSASARALGYGVDHPDLWLVARSNGAGNGAAGNGAAGNGHVAIAARGKAAVDAAYRAGLGAGGRDAGPPGPRPAQGPRYYAAHLLDPDGLRVEVVSGSRS